MGVGSDFAISKHAREQMLLRGIHEETVFEALLEPDKIEDEGDGQLVYQKKLPFSDGKNYLLRVFVNSGKRPKTVKTVYKTSKFSKYQ